MTDFGQTDFFGAIIRSLALDFHDYTRTCMAEFCCCFPSLQVYAVDGVLTMTCPEGTTVGSILLITTPEGEVRPTSHRNLRTRTTSHSTGIVF